MLPEFGFLSLLLVGALTFCLAVMPLYGLWRQNTTLIQLAFPLSFLYAIFASISLGVLAYSFISDDFSLEYVAQHSNSALPLFFKAAATWGGHEGSMLFWLFSLAIWTALFAWKHRHHDQRLIVLTLAIMGMIGFCFALFILCLSNPFHRLFPAALEGRDLNPMLQDIGLIVHPPLLYLGYVGFAINFALVISALIYQQFSAAFARICRYWVLISWGFLTVGIVLGSWWAYYELGWGGWWFWDPVENASFMPWLLATALLHSLIVYEQRGIFLYWLILLSLFTFALSLLGTFIVRSGILASVHAFTIDPQRGYALLAIFFIFTLGGLTLFALRVSPDKTIARFQCYAKETFFLLLNVLFTFATIIVLIGTFYPLIYRLLGWGNISVGAPYFNQFFLPLLLVIIGLMIFAPQLKWQKIPLTSINKIMRFIVPATIIAMGQIFLETHFSTMKIDPIALCLLILAWWLCLNSLCTASWFVWQTWGMRLAHLGVAMSIIGGTMSHFYAEEVSVKMQAGQTQTLHNYQLTYLGYRNEIGENYTAERTFFRISQYQHFIAEVSAERRFYDMRGVNMREVGIKWGWLSDIYIVIGNKISAEEYTFRLHYKPYVRWLWFGGIISMLGGIIAISNLRKRKFTGCK